MSDRAAVPRRARVDGRDVALDDATVAVGDPGFTRGDGAFETVGVWDGRPFRLGDHLDRLARSLAALRLPPPDREGLTGDVSALLDGLVVDAGLRLYVTAAGTRVATLEAPPDRAHPRRLASQPAPWVRPVGTWGCAGAKTLSYGPNMAAERAARAAGGDDALLVTLEGFVAEGPTFQLCWVADGTLHAPAVELGIVDSISRRSVLALARDQGVPTVEGRWPLAAVLDADEVWISSALRPLTAVDVVDGVALPRDRPVGEALAAALQQWRHGGAAARAGAQGSGGRRGEDSHLG